MIGTTLITSSLMTQPIDNIDKIHQHIPLINNNEALTATKVTTQRNNVYLYGDISPESCEELKNRLTELDFNAKLFKNGR